MTPSELNKMIAVLPHSLFEELVFSLNAANEIPYRSTPLAAALALTSHMMRIDQKEKLEEEFYRIAPGMKQFENADQYTTACKAFREALLGFKSETILSLAEQISFAPYLPQGAGIAVLTIEISKLAFAFGLRDVMASIHTFKK